MSVRGILGVRTRIYLIGLMILLVLLAHLAIPVYAGMLEHRQVNGNTGNEVMYLRTETGKTYDMGNGTYRLVASSGTQHWKYDYSDDSEPWKDIDLTIKDGYLGTAPYELWIDGEKITLRDRKTGEITTIERLSVTPTLPFVIVPHGTGVSFQHILPSDKVPFEAQFRISGKNIATRAFDDEGELELETSFVDDILTEKLSQVKDKLTKKIRPARGNIMVDPTWQVGASTDDVSVSTGGGLGRYFSLTDVIFQAGYLGAAYGYFGGAARFLDTSIPEDTVIAEAHLVLTSRYTSTGTVVNTRLRAEKALNPSTFSTLVNFDARTWTTTYVNWDSIVAWDTGDTEYTSPDIKSVIDEVRGLGSPTNLCILWDDFEESSNVSRNAWAYDGSTTYAPKLVIEYAVPAPPTISSSSADSITTTGANLHGEITDIGSGNATNRGFEWDTNSGVPYANNWSEAGDFGAGTFAHTFTDMPDGTTIYWRSYAINAAGTGYSSEYSFTTTNVGVSLFRTLLPIALALAILTVVIITMLSGNPLYGLIYAVIGIIAFAIAVALIGAIF